MVNKIYRYYDYHKLGFGHIISINTTEPRGNIKGNFYYSVIVYQLFLC